MDVGIQRKLHAYRMRTSISRTSFFQPGRCPGFFCLLLWHNGHSFLAISGHRLHPMLCRPYGANSLQNCRTSAVRAFAADNCTAVPSILHRNGHASLPVQVFIRQGPQLARDGASAVTCSPLFRRMRTASFFSSLPHGAIDRHRCSTAHGFLATGEDVSIHDFCRRADLCHAQEGMKQIVMAPWHGTHSF